MKAFFIKDILQIIILFLVYHTTYNNYPNRCRCLEQLQQHENRLQELQRQLTSKIHKKLNYNSLKNHLSLSINIIDLSEEARRRREDDGIILFYYNILPLPKSFTTPYNERSRMNLDKSERSSISTSQNHSRIFGIVYFHSFLFKYRMIYRTILNYC